MVTTPPITAFYSSLSEVLIDSLEVLRVRFYIQYATLYFPEPVELHNSTTHFLFTLS